MPRVREVAGSPAGVNCLLLSSPRGRMIASSLSFCNVNVPDGMSAWALKTALSSCRLQERVADVVEASDEGMSGMSDSPLVVGA